MSEDAERPSTPACARCGDPMIASSVRTIFWKDDQPAIVDDIPAHVCSSCHEQYYDEDVADALRQLAEEGFPRDAAHREIVVPVFSLRGRIRRPRPLPDDVYLD
jgi:YgiT-type zinc finger domain-containing protein